MARRPVFMTENPAAPRSRDVHRSGLREGGGNMQEEKAYRTTFERWNDRNRAAISAYSRSRHRLAGQR